ncbi:MAG: hypothetical protein ABJH05_12615 [Fulvivirga sp.]
MKFIRRLFNFFDQIAIEYVKHGKAGQESAMELNDAFKVGLRIFHMIILYGIYYVAFKLLQLLTSWLFDVPIEYNHIAFPMILLLFVSEYGMTKRNIYTLKNFTLLLTRSAAKYLVIFGIDVMVIGILKWMD